MKNTKFYVCPQCNNVITASNAVEVTCCGDKREELEMKKATDDQKLTVERVENDYYITSSHPMTKEEHISFVALLNGDSLILRRQYPEWDLQVRIPVIGHGKLVWYSTRDGLCYQLV